MDKILRIITSYNLDEDFWISFLKVQNKDGEELYQILIINSKTEQRETAEFPTEDAAKEVYFNFLNWSIKGLHTFNQRIMVLKDFEKQYKNQEI